MSNVVCKEVFVVEYLETGWGYEKWRRDYDTKDEALTAVLECNSVNTKHCSEIITAQYIGRELREVQFD